MQNIFVVTTLPNQAIMTQISSQAFQARVNVAKAAARADVEAGLVVFALCEEELLTLYNGLDGVVFVKDTGTLTTSMGVGRRMVIQAAADLINANKDCGVTPVIFWREPEKTMAPFVADIVRPIQDGEADIVIPRRASLESYPTFSQEWEATGSLVNSLIVGGEPRDYWFGPRAFSAEMAKYFLAYPGEQHLPDWHDCIAGPVLDAAMAGVRIGEVTVDFHYPKEQMEAEERDLGTIFKRMKVMRVLLQALADRREWNLRQR